MLKIAIYGKGGIGKSTVTANLAAAFALSGLRVIQIGCDPKADSTINLLGGMPLQPVMDFMREHDADPELDDIMRVGFGGVRCIETGGPTPGLGCAGRGIVTTFSLQSSGVPRCPKCGGIVRPDVVLYEEPLDSEVVEDAVEAISAADTLIIGGTSLVVYPAAGLIDYFQGRHLVLINKSITAADRQAELAIHASIGEVMGEAVAALAKGK